MLIFLYLRIFIRHICINNDIRKSPSRFYDVTFQSKDNHVF